MNKLITSIVLVLLLQYCNGRYLFGLLDSSNTIIKVDGEAPGNIISSVAISGLGADERAIGMDFRPFDGRLYLVTTGNNIYYVNTLTGVATLFTALGSACTIDGTLTYAVDFNPSADALRIISSTGSNYRVVFASKTCTPDTTITTPSFVQVAYSSNFRGASSSDVLLYTIATNGDLGVVTNPNSGTYVSSGSLGLTIEGAPGGFDSVPETDTSAALYWAALRVGNSTELYDIAVTGTIKATTRGQIGTGAPLRSIAISLSPFQATFFGLTTANNLIRWESEDPSSVITASITGADSDLLGVDFRPSDGKLYAVSAGNRVYVINTLTYAATQVGTVLTGCSFGAGSFGIDWNPVANQLRVISSTGGNFRINVETSACVTEADINASPPPTITAFAYTNNFVSASSTVLTAIDTANNAIGTVSTVAPTVGAFTAVNPISRAVPSAAAAGFDIFSSPTVTDNAVAAVVVDTLTYIVSANTNTGLFSFIAQPDLGASTFIRSLSAFTPRTPPTRSFYPRVVLLTSDSPQQAIVVESTAPGTVVSTTAITGLTTGTTLLAMDLRPFTGQLVGVSSDSRIYIIDTATAVAYPQNFINCTLATTGAVYSLNFNPVADRLRIVSNFGENYRVNVDTGSCIVDGNLNYTFSPNNNGVIAVGVAYSNSVNGTTTTAEYVVDSQNDVFSQVINPNGGTTRQIGSTGIDLLPGRAAPIDIYTNGGQQQGFIAAGNTLYDLNIGAGQLRPYGAITTTANIIGLTVIPENYVPPPLPPPSSTVASSTVASTSTGTSTGTTGTTGATSTGTTAPTASTGTPSSTGTTGATNGATNSPAATGTTTTAFVTTTTGSASAVAVSVFALACTIALLL